MDKELYDILDSYKTAIDVLLEKLDKTEQRIKYLEEDNERLNSAFYDEIINPAKNALDEFNKKERFSDFTNKYGEKLSSYNETLKPFEGEDFDFTKTAFDEYDALENKPEADTYVDELIKQVDEQIESIKKALGIPEDTQVEVKKDEDGNTCVEIEKEVATSEPTEEIVETTIEEPVETTIEEPVETPVEETNETIDEVDNEEPVADTEESDSEEVDNSKEVEDFEDELRNYLK